MALPEPNLTHNELTLGDFRDLDDVSDAGAPGLYALIADDDTVTYIGQTQDLTSRVSTHRRSPKMGPFFTKILIYPLSDLRDRLRAEAILILRYLPARNQALSLRVVGDGTGDGAVYEIRWPKSKKRRARAPPGR